MQVETTGRHSPQPPADPFHLKTPWQQLPGVGRLLNAAATHALALPPLTRVYRALEHCRGTIEFTGKALEVMGVGHQIDTTDAQRIPDQGAAIDGLIKVDLPRTKLKTLQKYMGREEAENYLSRHSRESGTAQAGCRSEHRPRPMAR